MMSSGGLMDGVRRLAFGRLTPAQRALLAVVRPVPDRDYPLDEVLRLDEGARGELLALLRRHGLGGWAHKVYRDAGVALPDDLAGPLRIEHTTNTARSVLALSAYERLSAILSRAGVDHVPLKGIRLIETLYPDPGTRQFGDIDLLIREADVERADAALRAAGYRGEEPAYWRRQGRYHHHHSYDAPPPFPVHVEVHWRLSHGIEPASQRRWIWEQSVPARSGESRERVLTGAGQVYGLVFHAAHHGYGLSLKWLLDLRLALEGTGDGGGAEDLARCAVEAAGAGACGLVLGLVTGVAGGACAARYRDACLARIPPWRRPVIRALAQPEVFLERGALLREKWPSYALAVWLSDGWRGRAMVVGRAVGFKLDLEGII